MRHALLLVLAFLAACDVTEPDNTEVAAPAGAGDAIEWVAGEWSTRFEMDADYELPTFRWFEGDCLTWDLVAEPHDCTGGMYFESSTVTDEVIEMIVEPELWNTTLAHELLHWALQTRTGNLDADHSSPWWNDVAEVQVGLCDYLNPGAGCVPN